MAAHANDPCRAAERCRRQARILVDRRIRRQHRDLRLRPGYEVIATLTGNLRTLVQVWRGDVSWAAALAAGDLAVAGPTEVQRAVPKWLGQSIFARAA